MNISKNLYQVNRKTVMELTDVLALIIGMQAGFSFLARVMKFLLEKCNWMNYTKEESTNLIDESENENKEDENDNDDDNHIELSSNIRSQNNVSSNNFRSQNY